MNLEKMLCRGALRRVGNNAKVSDFEGNFRREREKNSLPQGEVDQDAGRKSQQEKGDTKLRGITEEETKGCRGDVSWNRWPEEENDESRRGGRIKFLTRAPGERRGGRVETIGDKKPSRGYKLGLRKEGKGRKQGRRVQRETKSSDNKESHPLGDGDSPCKSTSNHPG